MSETTPLTSAQAIAKAVECRRMATHVESDSHRVMLQHMADTWERIAQDLLLANGHDK